MVYNATNFASSFHNHNSLAGIVHVTSWILQFIGHGFAEKKSPALKDNIAQGTVILIIPIVFTIPMLIHDLSFTN